MKKFMNDPADAVTDYLVGLAAAHPTTVTFDAERRIVVRTTRARAGKVGLVAGGGSGCEPLHTGFVGHGMLDAACPGEIFTSPVPKQIVAATLAADSGAGVLHVIKNFSGEVMNFGMATELLAFEGIAIDSVLVTDDVSIPQMPGTAGRRGLGATVLVEKIAGAAAERGDDLASVTAIARRVTDRARTFGVGLSSCTPPLRGKPIYDLPDGEIEFGIGISGEPGRERVAMRDAHQIADAMVSEVVTDLQPSPGAQLLVLVNGMGATPLSELYLLYGECDRLLRARGLEPVRSLVGNFVTSLDQAGAALTILELDDDLTVLWDAPVRTPSITWGAEA
ncbi:dihydroxyacetone kinase subunit DhaK [Cryobacterium levicorallinum]|uniref:Dihydroxyacetone kinase subunit DhaK n=1 Tax=Cryobacterium levicorallinum TaxID=995038 RepID=A0A1I3C0V4_9MICO|nr:MULTISPECIES: dihydroxyacetone kinase subunit DhaK [Cryobacterium]TFB85706.1 dihydroxyacetone kinase subunit DhaK [Cryobacterium levicorallinum]SFH68164.1 dihydroxyacetone kinase, N-terminal domain [Cryobacterium levicorallinum]